MSILQYIAMAFVAWGIGVVFFVLLAMNSNQTEYQGRACPSGETYVWSVEDEVARAEIPGWKPVMCEDELRRALIEEIEAQFDALEKAIDKTFEHEENNQD